MKMTFYPKGVCPQQFDLVLEDGIIKALDATGGCKGNLKGLAAMLKDRRAEEIIPILRGTVCGKRPTSCPDQISYALEEALRREKEQKEAALPVYSSSMEFDMDHEFMYHNYTYLRKENSPEFGAADPGEVVFRPICFDELAYLLHAKGTYLILFGGTWSQKTNSVIDQINYYARKHGIDTIYHFDFRCDGENEDTNFKADITAQVTYDGPGKKKPVSLAVCNYIYGEIVTRFLTNLNDWVIDKVGTKNDITYLNLYQDVVTVPNLREPFLFLYNRDNRVDYSGVSRDEGYMNEKGTYPIIAAMELSYYRDELSGKLYSSRDIQNEETEILNLGDLLEQGIFHYTEEDGYRITSYTHSDYMREAFQKNKRGHSFKTEDAFKEDEQINIQPVNWPQLRWMMSQKGSFIFIFGGPWCACTQSAVATVNDYAVANNVKVYLFDMRLDSKHPIDFWKYPRLNEMKLSSPGMMQYYIMLWEKFLPGAPILTSIDPNGPAWRKGGVTVTYTDQDGKDHTVLSVGVPYILSYNKDHVTQNGRWSPILASRHDAGELINTSENFIYYDPNYRNFKGGIYSVFYAYCESVGQMYKDITIDRTAPIEEGEPVVHVETVAYHKDHDWYKIFAEKYPATEESVGCC